jgi:hypothetical protein
MSAAASWAASNFRWVCHDVAGETGDVVVVSRSDRLGIVVEKVPALEPLKSC